MKTSLFFFTGLLLALGVAAQQTEPQMTYKKYAGRYGNSSGICLFEDGKFLMYGYATAVFGHYKPEKELLLFYPDKPELFQVFAHHNKSIGDRTRINFKGFEKAGNAFIQFGQAEVQRVFNEDANCFDQPFVFEMPGHTPSITLTLIPEASDFPQGQGQLENVWQYSNKEAYNDFILVCNTPAREYEDFKGIVVAGPDGDVLKLSSYGGDGGYRKYPIAEDEQWPEILQWKKQYEQSEQADQTIAFANTHYKIFPATQMAGYQFDEQANLYIAPNHQENDEYYKQNQYNDDRRLRRYSKLQPAHKQSIKQLKAVASKSLFFTVCGEGAEKSYKYNGYIKYDEPEGPPPVKTKPVPVPPAKKNKGD